MITPAETKKARNLLGWSQLELGIRSGLNHGAISKFEMSARSLPATKIAAIRAALEAAGVEFLEAGQPGGRITVKEKWLPGDDFDADG